MPKPRKCSFCGNDFPAGTGMMFVKNDGAVLWFCSGKCKKSSLKFGRDARKAQMDNVLWQGRERKRLKPKTTPIDTSSTIFFHT